ncbi:MAG: hypothetical protein IJA82_02745 [Clostridia bacterium]|nr:hypothetical protein [Clostridia bacterium]
MDYKITDETLNKILLSSPSALPLSPKEAGMKGERTKAFFYAFIKLLVDAINESLDSVKKDYDTIPTQINQHNKKEEGVHPFIINLISTLSGRVEDVEFKDKELGNAMQGYVDTHNAREEGVHPFLQAMIEAASDVASKAYNLALGRSKIYPLYGIDELITALSSEEYNLGDTFIFAGEGIPDLVLFEKGVDKQENDIDIEQGLSEDKELEPGATYFAYGNRLVSQESGYDHSKLALKTELEALASEVALKEYAKVVKTETKETVTLANKTEFNLGLRTSVIVTLPEIVDNDFEAIVNFRSGTVATSFDAPTELVFCQDDCNDGHFYPYSNRIYEINIKSVGGVLVARVGGADYEVVE